MDHRHIYTTRMIHPAPGTLALVGDGRGSFETRVSARGYAWLLALSLPLSLLSACGSEHNSVSSELATEKQHESTSISTGIAEYRGAHKFSLPVPGHTRNGDFSAELTVVNAEVSASETQHPTIRWFRSLAGHIAGVQTTLAAGENADVATLEIDCPPPPLPAPATTAPK